MKGTAQPAFKVANSQSTDTTSTTPSHRADSSVRVRGGGTSADDDGALNSLRITLMASILFGRILLLRLVLVDIRRPVTTVSRRFFLLPILCRVVRKVDSSIEEGVISRPDWARSDTCVQPADEILSCRICTCFDVRLSSIEPSGGRLEVEQ